MPTRTYTSKESVVRRTWYHTGSSLSSTQAPLRDTITTYVTVGGTVTHEGAVPSFKQKIRRHQSATSSLMGTRSTFSYVPGHVLQVRTAKPFINGAREYVWYETAGCINTLPRVPTLAAADETSADNQAISSFIREARGAQTALQSGVFLGELRESLKMVRSPARALRKGMDSYFRFLRKHRRNKPAVKRRILSETWLEYVFGWRPLISDIENGYEALQRMTTFRQNVKFVRGGGRAEQLVHDVQLNGNIGNVTWKQRRICTATVDVRYYGMVKIELNDPRVELKQNFGLTLQDFVPTVWELIPYSFLADYFTNIGDLLSAWSFTESNFAWKAKGVKAMTRETCTHINPNFPTSSNDFGIGREIKRIWEPGSSIGERTEVRRDPHSGPLIPSLGFQVPGFGSSKWINLSALARTHRSLRPY